MGDFQIIAHRGASHGFAENTIAAFDAALEEGADGIELDVQLSADGVPVIFHDDRLKKLGHPKARIRDFDFAALLRLDAGRWFGGEPARIPSLDEVLDAYADKTRLYLEIKHTENNRQRHEALAHAVAKSIAANQFGHTVSVLSFHNKALSAVMATHPHVACVRNVDYGWQLGWVRRRASQLAGISFNIERFKLRHASALAAFNLPLFSYTCNSVEQLQHARTLGVTHFITNYPARSRKILAAG